MGMRIDEAGDDRLSVPSSTSAPAGAEIPGGDTSDQVSLDEDVGSRRPVEDILY